MTLDITGLDNFAFLRLCIDLIPEIEELNNIRTGISG